MTDHNKIIEDEKKFFDFYQEESEIPYGVKKLYLETLDKFIIDRDNKKKLNLLDVGCGSGIIKKILDKKNKINFYGIDLSEKLLSQAKEKGYIIKLGDFLSEGFFEDIKFDIVIFHNSIHHLYDLNKTLEVTNKITNKNSVVMIFDPNGDSIVNKISYLARFILQKITFNKINIDGIASKNEKNQSGYHLKKIFNKINFSGELIFYSEQFLENKNRKIYSLLIGCIKEFLSKIVLFTLKKERYSKPFFFLTLRN